MEIREIKENDHQYIYKLIKNELGYDKVDFEQLETRLKVMKKDPNYMIFVAEKDDQVVGFIGLMQGLALEIEGKIIRIIALAVSKDYQGNQIGSSLVKYSEEYAHHQGVKIITLNSGRDRKTAHRFYQKHGYLKKDTVLLNNVNNL